MIHSHRTGISKLESSQMDKPSTSQNDELYQELPL